MPVPDLIFLGICGVVTVASVGIATGCAIGVGNARAQRDAAKAKLDKAVHEVRRWKGALDTCETEAKATAEQHGKIARSLRAAWKNAENELALYRAHEPARLAAHLTAHFSRIGKEGRAKQLAGSQVTMNGAVQTHAHSSRAAMRVEG